jgi:hypothetical protein
MTIVMKHCKHHGLCEHRIESRSADASGYKRPDYLRCLICQKEGNVKKRIKRQMFLCRLIESLGAKCSCCGYDECPEILHFHHVDSNTKKFNISEALSKMGKEITEKDMWEEVEKCILLCPNCHAKEHTEYSYYKLMENTNLLGV